MGEVTGIVQGGDVWDDGCLCRYRVPEDGYMLYKII